MADSILQSLLSKIDSTKRVIKRNLSDIVSNPLSAAENLGTQAIQDVTEQLKDPMNFVGGGAGIVKGNRALFSAHQAHVDDILNLLKSNKNLTGPSFSIASTANPNFGPISLIPREHVIDPAVNRSADVFSRDIFSNTSKKLQDLITSRSVREGKLAQDVALPTGRALDVLFASKAKSLEEAVSSPYFAGLLGNVEGRSVDPILNALREANPALQGQLTKVQQIQLSDALIANIGKDPWAARAIASHKTAPSRYMEVKLSQDLPVDRETISAAVLPSSRGMAATEMKTKEIESILRDRGIPTYRMDEAAAARNVTELPDLLKLISEEVQ